LRSSSWLQPTLPHIPTDPILLFALAAFDFCRKNIFRQIIYVQKSKKLPPPIQIFCTLSSQKRDLSNFCITSLQRPPGFLSPENFPDFPRSGFATACKYTLIFSIRRAARCNIFCLGKLCTVSASGTKHASGIRYAVASLLRHATL